MKLISFVVCCYNSQEYMRDAVDSLLKGGEEVEIIIVDDGSKDDTPKMVRNILLSLKLCINLTVVMEQESWLV